MFLLTSVQLQDILVTSELQAFKFLDGMSNQTYEARADNHSAQLPPIMFCFQHPSPKPPVKLAQYRG